MNPTSISQLVRMKLFYFFPKHFTCCDSSNIFTLFLKKNKKKQTSFCPLLFSLDSCVFLLQLSQRVALQRTNVKLCIRSFTNLYRRKGKRPTVWSSPSPTNACEYKRLHFKMGYLQLLLHLLPWTDRTNGLHCCRQTLVLAVWLAGCQHVVSHRYPSLQRNQDISLRSAGDVIPFISSLQSLSGIAQPPSVCLHASKTSLRSFILNLSLISFKLHRMLLYLNVRKGLCDWCVIK